jgi:hypothetical protein
MPKLDIEFELTGLKLKIKGESEDVTGKVADLQRQIQALMGTVTALAQNGAGTLPPPPPPDNQHKTIEAAPAQIAAPAATGKTRKGGGARKGVPQHRAEAIDFKHDAEKYGFPKQDWSTAQKAMWLLYMLTEDNVATELTAQVIAATFNKHFKSFKTILAHNVVRDLAKEKGKTGSVNSDATKNPETWHLLEAGKKQMAALIAETKGTPSE